MTVFRISVFLIAFFAFACQSGTSKKPAEDAGTDADADAEPLNNQTIEYPVDLVLREVDRFVIAREMGHLAFPALARLSDGRLILVYRQGAGHVEASGRIMKQFGTPDGRDWSTPEVLWDEPGIDDRDPSVTRLADGRLVVTYFQYRSQVFGSDRIYLHETFYLVSSDEGITFDPPVQITPGPMFAEPGTRINDEGRWVNASGELVIVHASSAPLVEVENRWILPNYGGNAINLNNIAGCLRSWVSLFSSTDQGTSWEETVVLPDALPNVWLQEPSLLYTLSGRFILQIRTAYGTTPGTPGDLAQSVSEDGGETWSPWKPFPFIGHAPDLFQLHHGAILSGFREINNAYTQEWVSLMFSLDDGESWSAPLQFEDCGAAECGYPSFAQLDDTHFLVVFYTARGETISGVVFEALPVFATSLTQ